MPCLFMLWIYLFFLIIIYDTKINTYFHIIIIFFLIAVASVVHQGFQISGVHLWQLGANLPAPSRGQHPAHRGTNGGHHRGSSATERSTCAWVLNVFIYLIIYLFPSFSAKKFIFIYIRVLNIYWFRQYIYCVIKNERNGAGINFIYSLCFFITTPKKWRKRQSMKVQ